MLAHLQSSTEPYENSGGYTQRRGHLSISDENHHVTEAIGYMYDDDNYDPQRDSNKHLSFLPSPTNDTITVAPKFRTGGPTSPTSLKQQQQQQHLDLPIQASSSDAGPPNGRLRPLATESLSADRNNGGQSPTTLNNRSPSSDSPTPFPLEDIDYESDPAAVAQELSNLAALRRMSMDVSAADPDLPSFSQNFGMPSIAPAASADEDDASRLFWVPARLHPGLAPKEFKTFLDSKAEQIKRRSGEFLAPDTGGGLGREVSGGGLTRKKSMLSRQIDDKQDGATPPKCPDGAHLDAVAEESSSTTHYRGSLPSSLPDFDTGSLIDDDKPILPPAPPGHSLRRSTRTTYRKGSLRNGERVPFSRRLARQTDPDADAVSKRSSTPAEDAPILGLTRVSTEPTPGGGGATNYSRPARSKPLIDLIPPVNTLEQKSETAEAGNLSRTPSQLQQWKSQISSNGRSTLQTSPSSQAVPQIVEPSPASEDKKAATKAPPLHQNFIPERKSSHDPPPSLPPQVPLPPEPTGSRGSKRSGFSRSSKEQSQSINEIESHPSSIPNNSTRTDTLSVIPTITEEIKKPESKKSKDKKDSEGRKSSWHWLRGTDEKDKDKKKEEESKKGKPRIGKSNDKSHDNTRLDLLQTSIDGGQKGRESLVLDRADIKLEEERRKDSVRKSGGSDHKKEKEPGIFSSFFGSSKKRSGHDSSHKKHSSRNLSPEPKMRDLRPDIDYNWTRFSILEERAIYRLAHIKLANPRRALYSQVLLSNFMYSYLAKVQQMHPQMSLPTSAGQNTARKKDQQQQDEYSQYQQYQDSQDHDQYGDSYSGDQMYDYDGDDRDDQHHRPQSRGHNNHQNGSTYGGGGHQQQQYHSQHSSFPDDDRDDDDDMW
ncbi:hypothetical protein AJ80_06011 [Polytolypa hystricis UAMH7299]|uniref:Protein Zds1 C-terminal domain-containing protein n=1 Tax=Polytolypa hystricis (strain UAMH7299) TaxID=1447883 RepID=A0A2B7XZR5_POLH7|nr:hypothetical protein AJ80_06011 [Polytolypa hystricis UAMH7299]